MTERNTLIDDAQRHVDRLYPVVEPMTKRNPPRRGDDTYVDRREDERDAAESVIEELIDAGWRPPASEVETTVEWNVEVFWGRAGERGFVFGSTDEKGARYSYALHKEMGTQPILHKRTVTKSVGGWAEAVVGE